MSWFTVGTQCKVGGRGSKVWYVVEFKVGWGSGKSPDTACERPIVLPEFRVLDRGQ